VGVIQITIQAALVIRLSYLTPDINPVAALFFVIIVPMLTLIAV